jgi:hypothetical protein
VGVDGKPEVKVARKYSSGASTKVEKAHPTILCNSRPAIGVAVVDLPISFGSDFTIWFSAVYILQAVQQKVIHRRDVFRKQSHRAPLVRFGVCDLTSETRPKFRASAVGKCRARIVGPKPLTARLSGNCTWD